MKLSLDLELSIEWNIKDDEAENEQASLEEILVRYIKNNLAMHAYDNAILVVNGKKTPV